MKELMILVERAVRPVRATGRRKMKMRQELLAHLTAAYEEELTRLGDEKGALEQAAVRFGDPAELTRSLQASVPFIEGILLAPMPGTKWTSVLDPYAAGKPGESGARRALCWAVFGFATCFLLLSGPAVSIYQSRGDAYGALLAAVWLAVTAGTVGDFLFFFHATCRALSGPLRPTTVLRAAGFAALATVPPTAAAAGMVHWMLEIPVHYGGVAVGTTLFFLWVLGAAWFDRLSAAANRLKHEWTSLEIGD